MSRIHHLDAGTMRPPIGRRLSPTGVLVDRVIAIELDRGGIALIDTGVGAGARVDPSRYLGAPAAAIAKPDTDAEGTAAAQLRALGLEPSAVSDIFITHLDFDHAAGLADFPDATVHVSAAELHAAQRPLPPERLRYLKANWAHPIQWAPFGQGATDTDLYGLAAHADIGGLGILAIPMPGHTRGHTAYAIPDGDGWLVHAGDAFYAAGQISDDPGLPVLRGLQALEVVFATQPWKIRGNHAKLRALAAHDGVTVVCSHDGTLIEPRAVPSV